MSRWIARLTQFATRMVQVDQRERAARMQARAELAAEINRAKAAKLMDEYLSRKSKNSVDIQK